MRLGQGPAGLLCDIRAIGESHGPAPSPGSTITGFGNKSYLRNHCVSVACKKGEAGVSYTGCVEAVNELKLSREAQFSETVRSPRKHRLNLNI